MLNIHLKIKAEAKDVPAIEKTDPQTGQKIKMEKVFVTPQLAEQHGLSKDEYSLLLKNLGRKPNLVELGMFAAMWSEHCSYKSTRVWLKTLPTTGPCVIQGPGENAGVIDIGDGQAAVFKIESHNKPSWIEPFHGAATGVGGILRDVFTMGARPIANLNALRFGDPKHPRTKTVIEGVVSGIGSYGNCVGIPTVGGEVNFHPAYNGNPMVNAMTVGIADADKIFYAKAAGVGNPVVYVGAKTGRDGIHGATMSSAGFNQDWEKKRPTVQVGDPFMEKLLLEACLELMATDAVVAIQDMGAAGLTSSSVEMASRGDMGIEMILDNVPCREPGMTAYEMMLSESQERMLIILQPGREELARKIFEKWDLDFAVIGKLTDTKQIILKHHGQVVADIPTKAIADSAPMYERDWVVATRRPEIAARDLPEVDLSQALQKIMTCPDMASKKWIYEQYDSMVMANTVFGPGQADAAVVRIEGTAKALAMTTDCSPRYCQAHPFIGGAQAVAESYRNLCAVGATPLAWTNNLNFGNPERREVMGQIVGAIGGLRNAGEALGYPVVSGNVSLYNETEGKAILPTPVIGGVGLLADANKAMSSHFKNPGDSIIVIGPTAGWLGASLFLREVHGREEGSPPPVDLMAEKKHGAFIRQLIADGKVNACHDVSDGGIATALVEMGWQPRGQILGAEIAVATDLPLFAYLFGEDQGRYIVTTPNPDAVIYAAAQAGVVASVLGKTGGGELTVNGQSIGNLTALRQDNDNWLPQYMNG
jgi:phosphoribosylformylglycinamidine synthase subunit PurL